MGEILSVETLFLDQESEDDKMIMEDNPLTGQKSTSNPEIIYHYEAMHKPDKDGWIMKKGIHYNKNIIKPMLQ